MKNLFDPDIFARFMRTAAQLSRGSGEGKHAAGRRKGRDYRTNLNRRRKAQRQARRYARLCAAGRKHRCGRP